MSSFSLPLCYWSMILSLVNCSVKMSVHEGIDIEPERASKSTGFEQSAAGMVERGGGGWGDGAQ